MKSATGSRVDKRDRRLEALGIQLPAALPPFGPYVETLQTGQLLFLSGIVPVVDHKPKFVGRLGKEVDLEQGREASYAASLSALGAARQFLRSLDRVGGVARPAGNRATSQPLGMPVELELIFGRLPSRTGLKRQEREQNEIPNFLSHDIDW